MKRYTIVVEKNDDGYWGQIQEHFDVFTHGDTIEALKVNSLEALKLYFEDEAIIESVEFDILIDLQEFFKLNDFINISKLAKRTGMNTSLLRQYSKGLKFPSLKQVSRIEKTINQIGSELMHTHLLTN